MNPTIGSGGTGLQHFAMRVAMLFTPSTITPDETREDGATGRITVGSSTTGASPRTAISIWREVTSPRPSAARNSSSFA